MAQFRELPFQLLQVPDLGAHLRDMGIHQLVDLAAAHFGTITETQQLPYFFQGHVPGPAPADELQPF
ncbi:hypothetical protein A8M77_27015 [Variovorax sp. JS1663]|nr:hypothetical protein A8M77_27015 [Variovorax sp. JS1663]